MILIKGHEARTDEVTQLKAIGQVTKGTGKKFGLCTLIWNMCPLPFRGPEREYSFPNLPVPFEIFETKYLNLSSKIKRSQKIYSSGPLSGTILPPGGQLAIFEDSFGCRTAGNGDCCWNLVDRCSQDTGKYPIVYKTAPQQGLFCPKIYSWQRLRNSGLLV